MMTSINKHLSISKKCITSNSIKCDRCGTNEKCVSLKCVLVFMLYSFLNPQYSYSYTIDSFVNYLSETYKVNGKIIDRETLEPIPFVALHIDKINRYTITDANGNFVFNIINNAINKFNIFCSTF